MYRFPAVCALVMGAILVLGAAVSAQESTLQIKGLTFVDHVTAGMIEQDVYVKKQDGSDQVYRVTGEEHERYLDRSLYTTAEPVKHEPFTPGAAGPYPAGQPLGFTLGDWLSGTGTASYQCADGKGALEARFENLVPGGVYTMWYAFAAKQMMGCAECPFATLDLPLGAPDGSQNVFRADSRGRAEFAATFSPCLKLSDERIMAMLAIAYHSDGKVYGPDPGPFGSVSHVHLFTPLPGDNAWAMAGK